MAEQIQQLEAGNIKISNDVVGKIAGMYRTGDARHCCNVRWLI